LCIVQLSSLIAAHQGSSAPTAGKYNILFMGTDQQRTSTLGCYGNDFAISPNLDRMAEQGTRFTDAYTVSPVCSPSRTSTLLGVHVPVHGVIENGVNRYMSADSLTPYYDVLKKQKYHTALIGKTHFTPVPDTIEHLDIHTGNTDKRGADVSEAEFLETYLTNQTMEWIGNVSAGGPKHDGHPWMVYLSMVSPHPPNWVPAGRWRHAYDGVKLPPLNYRKGNIESLPHQTRMLLGLLGKEMDDPPAFPMGEPNMTYIDAPTAQGTVHSRYDYYNQAAYVDHQVGRMLDFLDKKKLTNSTLVIFASDHGTELYDQGINNDKHTFLEGSWRIPLLMRLPGVLPANSTRGFATTLDISSTIIAVAGGTIPKTYQGFDLFGPLAEGKASPRKVGVGTEYRGYGVVTPSWKLSYFPEEDEGRLYDRRVDPQEQTDLYNSTVPAVAAARDGLRKALLRWRAQQDAIGYLQANSAPGAPTATLAYAHTEGLRGIDAEIRLQDDALAFEPAEPSTL